MTEIELLNEIFQVLNLMFELFVVLVNLLFGFMLGFIAIMGLMLPWTSSD